MWVELDFLVVLLLIAEDVLDCLQLCPGDDRAALLLVPDRAAGQPKSALQQLSDGCWQLHWRLGTVSDADLCRCLTCEEVRRAGEDSKSSAW